MEVFFAHNLQDYYAGLSAFHHNDLGNKLIINIAPWVSRWSLPDSHFVETWCYSCVEWYSFLSNLIVISICKLYLCRPKQLAERDMYTVIFMQKVAFVYRKVKQESFRRNC